MTDQVIKMMIGEAIIGGCVVLLFAMTVRIVMYIVCGVYHDLVLTGRTIRKLYSKSRG